MDCCLQVLGMKMEWSRVREGLEVRISDGVRVWELAEAWMEDGRSFAVVHAGRTMRRRA